MSRTAIRWLYQELPSWVREGVISEEIAEQLRARYGPVEAINRNTLALTVFAGLGAVAIGLGVIMLVAHNWDELGRGARTVVSFAPLLLTLGAAAWVLANRPQSIAWREGIGAALALAIGACISLISQTYNISGELDHFILTWMLLGAPVVYILGANAPAIMYFAGLATWSHMAASPEMGALYWGLLAVIAPYYLMRLKNDSGTLGVAWLSWAFCLSMTIALFGLMGEFFAFSWRLAYTGMFASFILVDRLTYSKSRGMFHRAFAIVGMVGLLITLSILSYEDFWSHYGGFYYPEAAGGTIILLQDSILLAAFIAAGLSLAVYSLQRKQFQDVIIGLTPLFVAFGVNLAIQTNDTLTAALLVNFILLTLGVAYILFGLKSLSMGRLNLGVVIITFLILFRFMDEGFGLVERGIAFILLGAIFLGVNVFVVQKSKTIEGGAS